MVLKRIYLVFFITLLSLGLVSAGLAAARTGANSQFAEQDTGESAETSREQDEARQAEISDSASKTVDTLFSGNAVQYPLFVGVDDVNVPAYQIDPITNDTVPAFVGTAVWGSAYDPDNDRILFNSGTALYEWPIGGTVNLLGTITDPGANPMSMVGLAYHNGNLYASRNIANEAIYIIDLNTLIANVYIDYTDGDFDYGGISFDPNTGELYGTNDDASPNGSGLFRINMDGSGTLISPYPAGQTDIDGLAVSHDGYAYLVIDEPGDIFVYDFGAGSYTTPLTNPWTTSETFSAGAWVYELVSISLAKTVGLDPNICASSDMTYAPAGTEVTYCYEVLNTGEVTLTLHTLEDSQLGTVLLDFPYDLAPAASVFLTASHVVTATVVNTATWTAYNPGPIDVVTDTDSATVYVWSDACPAGYDQVVVASADFEDFPPFGWTVDNTSTGCTGVPEWTNTDPGGRGNLTGGGGSFAIADSDQCSSGSVMNTTMTSPMLNFSGLISPTITFFTDYNDFSSSSDVANFDVSLDGGLSWQNILSWNQDVRGPLQVGTALPGGGQDDVKVRWDYQNATWDWWWEVDDVVITACGQFADIEVSPDALSGTQVANQVVTHTLTISNVGNGALDWMIDEEATIAQSEQTALPAYVSGVHAPSSGQVPVEAAADGFSAVEGGAGIQTVLGTNVRSWNSLYGSYFTRFNLDDPEWLPYTAPFTGTGNFIGAGEFVNGLSYMLDTGNNLFVVDDSGALVDQYLASAPPGGEAYSGMALDPTTGDVFASSTSVVSSTLSTLDVATGNAVVVGPIMGSPGNIAIAFDGAGNLFGYDIVNDSFMQIDPATGDTSNVVPLPFDANFGQGMMFDPASGLLYILGFNNGMFRAELWSVDTSNPAAPVFNFVDLLGSSLPGNLNQLSWGGTDNCLPSDIAWLSASPSSGSTDPGLSDMVEVTFDSTGLSPDVYTGNLCVRSNDQEEPVLRVPVTLTVELGADLSLVKTASKEPVAPGETFMYTLVVENSGPDPASNTTLVDKLPSGVTFISASAGCMEAGGVVTCDLGTLAVGEMSEVKFTVAAPQAEGVITNSAVVSADELDINPTDNSSSVDTTVMMYHVYLPMAMR